MTDPAAAEPALAPEALTLARSGALLIPALQEPGAVVIDGTLGLGGHAQALLEAAPNCRLIGIDRDLDALDVAGRRLAPFGGGGGLVPAASDETPNVVARLGPPPISALLLDLGVSSLQLDDGRRGFAYSR